MYVREYLRKPMNPVIEPMQITLGQYSSTGMCTLRMQGSTTAEYTANTTFIATIKRKMFENKLIQVVSDSECCTHGHTPVLLQIDVLMVEEDVEEV